MSSSKKSHTSLANDNDGMNDYYSEDEDLNTEDDMNNEDVEDIENDEEEDEEQIDVTEKILRKEVQEEEEVMDEIDTPDNDMDFLTETEITEQSTSGMVLNENRITKPFLSKYERARVLATRSKQLSLGAKPLIKIETKQSGGTLTSLDIAKLELKEKMIPFVIRRRLPSGYYELWKISELD